MRTAVVGYMTHQINLRRRWTARSNRASCRAVTGGTTSRQVFRCQVTASAQNVTYPVRRGGRSPRSGVITYCQRVAPPVPSMNVPVSKRCT